MMKKDKALHFIAGLAIVLVLTPLIGAVYSLIVCVFVAVAKEVYDSFFPKTRHAEVWDAVATVLGGLAGLLFFL